MTPKATTLRFSWFGSAAIAVSVSLFAASAGAASRLPSRSGSPSSETLLPPYAIDGNSDGVADVITVEVGFSVELPRFGSVQLQSGTNLQTLYTVTGSGLNEQFGYRAVGVPDMNGDGVAELAVTAPLMTVSGGGTGAVSIYSGANGVLIRSMLAPSGARIGLNLYAVEDQTGDGVAELLASGGSWGILPDEMEGWSHRTFLFSGGDGRLLTTFSQSIQSLATYSDNGGVLFLPADLDGSGAIDVWDVIAVAGAVGSSVTAWTGADLTGDGLVTSLDLTTALSAYFLGDRTAAQDASVQSTQGQTDLFLASWEDLHGDGVYVQSEGTGGGEAGGGGGPSGTNPPGSSCECGVTGGGQAATGGPSPCPAYIPSCPSGPIQLHADMWWAGFGSFGSGTGCTWSVVEGAGLIEIIEVGSGGLIHFRAIEVGTVTMRIECTQGECCGCSECTFTIIDGSSECNVAVEIQDHAHAFMPPGAIPDSDEITLPPLEPGSALGVWARGWPAGGEYRWTILSDLDNVLLGITGLNEECRVKFTGAAGEAFIQVEYGSFPSCVASDIVRITIRADSDGDRIPDDTEISIGTDPFDPDTDDDGYNDYCEWRSGSDPVDPLSVPANGLEDSDRDGLSDLEETCTYGTDPDAFDTDQDGVQDYAELRLGLDPFSRYSQGVWDRQHPQYAAKDLDQDLVFDEFEDSIGLNSSDDDSDSDGDLDGIELRAAGRDPLSGHEHPLPDFDGDELSDLFELYVSFTHPRRMDSDGDLLPDGLEVRLGLDPLLVDSDADGVTDANEDFDGDGIANVQELLIGTDPTLADSDGDGTGDGDELSQGSSPTNAQDRGLPIPADLLTVWHLSARAEGNCCYPRNATSRFGNVTARTSEGYSPCFELWASVAWQDTYAQHRTLSAAPSGRIESNTPSWQCTEYSPSDYHVDGLMFVPGRFPPEFFFVHNSIGEWRTYPLNHSSNAGVTNSSNEALNTGSIEIVSGQLRIVLEHNGASPPQYRATAVLDHLDSLPEMTEVQWLCSNATPTNPPPDPGTKSLRWDLGTVSNIEGIQLECTVEFSIDTPGPSWSVTATTDELPVSPSLQIDSNNNDGFDEPSDDPLNDVTSPGKIIFVNRDDTDRDGVPDFVDGLGFRDSYWDGGELWGSLAPGDVRFVPIELHLGRFPDPDQVMVQFTFSDAGRPGSSRLHVGYPGAPSNPADSLEIHDYRKAEENGRLRLWTKDGREPRSVNHNLLRSGWSYPVSTLDPFNSGKCTLYIEAVSASPTAGEDRIAVSVTGGLACSGGCLAEVSLTAVDLQIVDGRVLQPWVPVSGVPDQQAFLEHDDIEPWTPPYVPDYTVDGAITDGVSLCLIRVVPTDLALDGFSVSILREPSHSTELLTTSTVGGFFGFPTARVQGRVPLPLLPLSPADEVSLLSTTSGTISDGLMCYVPPDAYYDARRGSGLQHLDAGDHTDLSFALERYGMRVGSAPFVLRRPPLLLVHGYSVNLPPTDLAVWGPAWSDVEARERVGPASLNEYGVLLADGTTRYIETRTYRADWHCISLLGLDKSFPTIPETIATALHEYRTGGNDLYHATQGQTNVFLRDKRFAATRVDVLAHSMGGQAVRFYITDASGTAARTLPVRDDPEDIIRWRVAGDVMRFQRTPEQFFRRPDNYGVGDIRRLVTVGSPHEGSQLAFVHQDLAEKYDPVVMQPIARHNDRMAAKFLDCSGDYITPVAALDLAPESTAQRIMESSDGGYQLPDTNWTIGGFGTPGRRYLAWYPCIGYGSCPPSCDDTEARKYLLPCELDRIGLPPEIFNDNRGWNSDMAVPTESQGHGATLFRMFYNVVHTHGVVNTSGGGETDSTEIAAHVIDLLSRDVDSFNQNGLGQRAP